jgi:hypothetical protein
MISAARSESATTGISRSASPGVSAQRRVRLSANARLRRASSMRARQALRVRTRHTGHDENPTPRADAMRQRVDAGTSLAPRRNQWRSLADVRDPRTHARVKMLDDKIAFDIPSVVPEHVPPRCGAPSGDSTDNLWTTSYDRSRYRAPRLSGLCKRGIDQ